jgi:CRP/FNR family transcriptional regulator, cyclic AMP receptor protein
MFRSGAAYARVVANIASRPAVGFILEFDPDLGSRVCPEDWDSARSECRGDLVRVPAGAWDAPDWAGERDDLFGFVIIDGLLCREVALRDRCMFELLGPGDVLQLPVVTERPRLGGPVRLTAAAATTLVALGESFARAAVRWPSLLAAIHRRLEAQRENLAIQGLITHLPRAEHRLLLVLWHLADRWGRVIPEGTLLPLSLTHDLLGQLTAARRSTVTLAVTALQSQGYISRMGEGTWLLTPAAEDKAAAIARTNWSAATCGDAFRHLQCTREVSRESRALRAEARQLRTQAKRAGTWFAR